MSEIYNQNYSELLTYLVDGELNDTESAALFTRLADNEDLRTEMQDHLRIRESVRNDSEAFTPPIDATKAVFTSLGFNPPYAQTNMVPTNPWMNYAKRYGSIALLMLVSSIFTAVFMMNIYEKQETNIASNDSKNPIPSISSKSDDIAPIDAAIASPAQINDNNIQRNSSQNKAGNGIENKHSSIATTTEPVIAANNSDVKNNSNQGNMPQNTFASNIPQTNYSNKYNTPTRFPSDMGNRGGIFEMPEIIEVESSQTDAASSSESRGYMITGTGSFGQGSIGADANLAAGYNLGIYLSNSQNFQIGFLFGREPFSIQVLNESNGQYENNPNQPVTWAGVSGRYQFSNLTFANSFIPFGNMVLGATEYGMLGKFGTGLQYNITNSIGTALGLEYSLLSYSNQSQNIIYNKFGLTGTLLIRL
jgi:negative regulator of sigma E activity